MVSYSRSTWFDTCTLNLRLSHYIISTFIYSKNVRRKNINISKKYTLLFYHLEWIDRVSEIKFWYKLTIDKILVMTLFDEILRYLSFRKPRYIMYIVYMERNTAGNYRHFISCDTQVSKRCVEACKVALKALRWNVLFSLMHMQCSFLDPFWVASFTKGVLKQTRFDTCESFH